MFTYKRYTYVSRIQKTRKVIIAGMVLLLTLTATGQNLLPIKLVAITNVTYSGGYADNTLGAELNAFKVPENANSVKMQVQIRVKDYAKYTSKLLRMLITNNSSGETILSTYWNRLYKDTVLKSEAYFPAGDYNIRLIDNNDTSVVLAKRFITVQGTAAKATGSRPVVKYNGYSYDVNKFKLWVCQSVDEVNWKPIGQLTKIKTGGCATFFFDSPEKIKNPGTMRWKLYRVGADGKETFVNQRDQTPKLEEFRKIYYEECDEFRTPGKYRIYFAIRNESEAYYGVRDTDYFATADISVE